MRYKEDWELAKKRLTAYWDREIVDRCCISVKVSDPALKPLLEKWKPHNEQEQIQNRTDPDFVIAKNRLVMEHTYYGGEAIPFCPMALGASGHAGYFKGARYKFDETTTWFFPSLTDMDSLEFDENSFLFQKTLSLAKALAQDGAGDYFVPMPPHCGNADALANLVGSEELLASMIEEPEAVQRALAKLQLAYERVMREVYHIVRDVNDGGSMIGWMNTWAPGFLAQMQCDLSVMISNPMFREFIMPELRAQSKLLEYPVYHLDGVEQVRHLDDLLSIPELRAIQWTQVAGQKPCTAYIPELKRIQVAGKNLVIIVTPDQIEALLENLSSRGLLLVTTASSRYEADEMLKRAGKLTHD